MSRVTEMTTPHRGLVEDLPSSLVVELVGTMPDSIEDLTHDSREVQPGWAFACVPGGRFDGHDFAGRAVADGAALLLVDHRLPTDVVGDCAQLVVTDVRRAMGFAAASVHGHPASSLTLVGITGTNGKTTTTQFIGSVLRAAGREERQLGTLSGARTTPEAPDLQRRLAGFVSEGVDTVVMEVSSHALALHRVAGTRFDVAVFTNLGRDHLDLHESMEAYFRAKASLFMPDLSDLGITNLDDPYGRLLLDVAAIEMVGYSAEDAVDLAVGLDHHRFVWRGQPVHVPIGGGFNVSNSLAALYAAEALGIDAATAARGLAEVGSVPGRFEVVSGPDAPVAVVVDYAHTPEGLEHVLRSARRITTGRVIVVFGCGGDRDSEKRPLMGAAAAANADLVMVTSDNPRHEDPQAIVDSVLAGIEGRYGDRVSVELDRRAAIESAVDSARAGDVVVIAGKGHETTQTIGDQAHPFDDREVARAVLLARGDDT